MSELAPTPWAYRPLEQDDWGTIRAADGAIVARAREGKFGITDYDAFRADGLDPYELMGQRIVAAVNRAAEYDREVERRREAEALALQYQATAAEQGSHIFRMRLALQLARAWTMNGEGYSGSTRVYLENWIDAGMTDPLPWPDDLPTRRWLLQHGYDRTGEGHVGMTATAEIVDA